MPTSALQHTPAVSTKLPANPEILPRFVILSEHKFSVLYRTSQRPEEQQYHFLLSRGAPRSESIITMIAGGDHTIIHVGIGPYVTSLNK